MNTEQMSRLAGASTGLRGARPPILHAGHALRPPGLGMTSYAEPDSERLPSHGNEICTRLLIVQDDPRPRAFLARALKAEGFLVDATEHGENAFARALKHSYELVIFDLVAAGRDGLDLLHELRALRPHLAVLILSARVDLTTKLRGFELGAVDFVERPFSLEELLARARAHVRRAHVGGDDATIRTGELVLDLRSRRARVGSTIADLSDREFHLLHFLMLHVGEVVSRERLLAHVWGYDFDPRSNVVDVCVRRLRARLGPHNPIETVRHAGYRAAV